MSLRERLPVRWNGPWRTLAKTGIGLLVAFVVAEAGVRLYRNHFASRRWLVQYSRSWDNVPPGVFRFAEHPYLPCVPNPEFRSADGKDRHNRLGFRGDEIAAAKPAGVFRIVCLGGSTTYTAGVDDAGDAYPAQLQRILREKHGRANVEVVNAGVHAFTSLDSLLNLELRVLPLEPDLIVVYHGINDLACRLVPPDRYHRDNSGYALHWSRRNREEPPRWWHHSLLAYCCGVKLGWIPEHRVGQGFIPDTTGMSVGDLARNPPVYFERNLRAMTVLVRDAGAEIMFATFACSESLVDPLLLAGLAENNEVVRRLGARLNVPVFDFAGRMPKDREFWFNFIHVNRAGAARTAELFAEFIDETFCAGKSGQRAARSPE